MPLPLDYRGPAAVKIDDQPVQSKLAHLAMSLGLIAVFGAIVAVRVLMPKPSRGDPAPGGIPEIDFGGIFGVGIAVAVGPVAGVIAIVFGLVAVLSRRTGWWNKCEGYFGISMGIVAFVLPPLMLYLRP